MNRQTRTITLRSLIVGAALAVTAASLPSGVDAYPPGPPGPGEPALDVTAFAPVCLADAPYIQYTIKPLNFQSAGPATLTFRDVNGRVVDTITVTSLSGTVIYPGAEVDADGNATDWPGWKYENGMWVLDSSDAVLRQGLTVTVTVNPTATATVSYPLASSACAGPAVAQAPAALRGSLPDTGGSDLPTTLALAASVLAAGLAVTAVASRARSRRAVVATPPGD